MKRAADFARRWLEEIRKRNPATNEAMWVGGSFDFLCHSDLRLSLVQDGRVLASFRVPTHLTDEDGNWQPGAIATLVDNVGAAAIATTEGIIKVSVEFDICFFSSAKLNEEVEIDARVVEHKGKKLTAVAVEVCKKEGGHLVAVGRQWMSSSRAVKHVACSSKL